VLAPNEVEMWRREMKEADAERRFTFAGMMFAVTGKRTPLNSIYR